MNLLLDYSLHSFISFEHICKVDDRDINHYTTLALDSNGYYIYDDLLNLPKGNWQGGFVKKSAESYTSNMKQFIQFVPVFILQKAKKDLISM